MLQKHCLFVSECQELVSVYIINSYSFQHKAPILRVVLMNSSVQNVMNLKKDKSHGRWGEGKVGKKPHRVDAYHLIHNISGRSSEPQIQGNYIKGTGFSGSLFPFVHSFLLCSKEMWNKVQNHLCRESKIPEKSAEKVV